MDGGDFVEYLVSEGILGSGICNVGRDAVESKVM